MESKLLVGGKTIMDHTNEQQKMLELKRQEIAEQVCRGRKSVPPPSFWSVTCLFGSLICPFFRLCCR